MAKIEFTILPVRCLIRVDWQELIRFRDIFLVLTWCDISVRYKQTALGALGVLWVVIQSLLTMVVLLFGDQ